MGNDNEGLKLARVLTNSMAPVIWAGEKVVILTKAGKIRRGDIVSFHSKRGSGVSLVHRVVNIKRGGLLVTCGDNSRKFDEAIKFKNLYGKVAMVKVNGKWRRIDGSAVIKMASYFLAYLSYLSIRYPKTPFVKTIKRIMAKSLRVLIRMLN